MKTIKAIPILLIPMLFLTGIAPVGIAYAETPSKATGRWIALVPASEEVQMGKSCMYTRTDTGTIIMLEDDPGTGMVGEGSVTAVFTINRCSETIRWILQAEYVFAEGDLTVAGRTGGAVLRLQAKGISDPIPSFHATLHLVSATGELENLHLIGKAQLTIPPLPPSPTYEIITHFDP